jgi:protein gp37
MGTDSKIEWTHHTFNPWMGCAKAHKGCTNCYAEVEQAIVMRKGGRINWGEVWQGGDRVVVADSTWKHPFTWARKAAKAGERHRVFCASLSDVLEVPSLPKSWPSGWGQEQRDRAARDVHRIGYALDEARERLWDTIRKTAAMRHDGKPAALVVAKAPALAVDAWPGLDWLLLTKRPENWRLIPEDVRPLVWLGTSVSDQETADEWVPRLLQARGFRYRFLSVEPLVGPVDFAKTPCGDGYHNPLMGGVGAGSHRALDWVIVGGESGSKARPCNVEWVRSIVTQCREAGVPCHVKQLGARPVGDWGPGKLPPLSDHPARRGEWVLPDDKGGDWNAWPEDLRVREFPR